ncbi:serine hydroxymethyltransferase, cytosolic-like isoform 1-T4 [Fundulus diaphanus]
MSQSNGYTVSDERWESHKKMMVEPLAISDSEVFSIIRNEKHKQIYGLELIAAENFTSRAVLEALGSCMTNKYSKGFPGQSYYYNGLEYNDDLETLCQRRALEAFGLDSEKWGVNVRPYSGSPANFAVYTAVVEPRGRIMALDVPDGGHLSHGFMTDEKKIAATSIFFETMPYKLNPETGYIDYDKLQENARLFHPKLIIAGTSCYSRNLEYDRLKQIANENGAYLMGDMAHISGLVAAGVVPSPFEHCDIVTTTTHKSLRGCRGGLIFYRKGVRSVDAKGKETLYNLEFLINQAVFPGLQGGPHNNNIAGVAVALKQAMTPEFKAYQLQVLANCKALSSALMDLGYKIVTGGSDNHLILLDLRNKGADERLAEKVLQACAVSCNKSTCLGFKSALLPSGLKLGSPALTSRGLIQEDFKKVAHFVHRGIELALEVQRSLDPTATLKEFIQALAQGEKFQQRVAEIRTEVEAFSRQFPMPGLPEL